MLTIYISIISAKISTIGKQFYIYVINSKHTFDMIISSRGHSCDQEEHDKHLAKLDT